jgi:hypothetical protein
MEIFSDITFYVELHLQTQQCYTRFLFIHYLIDSFLKFIIINMNLFLFYFNAKMILYKHIRISISLIQNC